MAVPVLPLLVLGGALLALASGDGDASAPRARARRGEPTRRRVCALSTDEVSLEDADEQDRWVRCPGRTLGDVQELAGRLTAADRLSRAQRVVALWHARHAVESAAPDGRVDDATRADVERTQRATDEELARMETPDPPETLDESAAEETREARTRSARGGGRGSRVTELPQRDVVTDRSTGESTETESGEARTIRGELGPYANPRRRPPVGYDASIARATASALVTCLNTRSHSQCRRRLRDWQRAAGIPADGQYGPLTYNALRAFGQSSAPVPRSGRGTGRHVYVVPAMESAA